MDRDLEFQAMQNFIAFTFEHFHFASRSGLRKELVKRFSKETCERYDEAFEAVLDNLLISMVDANRADKAFIGADVYYLKPWSDRRKEELGVIAAEGVIAIELLKEAERCSGKVIVPFHTDVIANHICFLYFANGLDQRLSKIAKSKKQNDPCKASHRSYRDVLSKRISACELWNHQALTPAIKRILLQNNVATIGDFFRFVEEDGLYGKGLKEEEITACEEFCDSLKGVEGVITETSGLLRDGRQLWL